MKRFFLLVLVSLCAVSVLGDTVQTTVSVTNGQAATLSSAIPISGELDKIEIIQSVAAATSTVVIATRSGTTAVDTFLTLTDLVGNKVVRPRIIGTTTAGVNLAAATQAGSDATTNTVGTALVGLYEKPIIGGNVKMAVTGTYTTGTNTVTAILYYNPLPK